MLERHHSRKLEIRDIITRVKDLHLSILSTQEIEDKIAYAKIKNKKVFELYQVP